jgi:hypothetical protein
MTSNIGRCNWANEIASRSATFITTAVLSFESPFAKVGRVRGRVDRPDPVSTGLVAPDDDSPPLDTRKLLTVDKELVARLCVGLTVDAIDD